MSDRESLEVRCNVCGEVFSTAVEARNHGRIHRNQAGTGKLELKVDVSMTPAEEREIERKNQERKMQKTEAEHT